MKKKEGKRYFNFTFKSTRKQLAFLFLSLINFPLISNKFESNEGKQYCNESVILMRGEMTSQVYNKRTKQIQFEIHLVCS